MTATAWRIGDETSNTPWITDDGSTQVDVVMTCEGTNLDVFVPVGGSVRYMFNGSITAGRTVQQILYPAILDLFPFWDDGLIPGTPIWWGVEALNTALHSYGAGTKILVFGHSMGAEVIGRWLANHANDTDAPDPADVSFLQIGNPERKYGGIFSEGAPFPRITSGGHHTPTDTAYTVIDCKIQYDLYADWPTADFPNPESIANAMSGLLWPHTFGYLFRDLNDPTRLTYQEGNTTFVLLPDALLSGVTALNLFDPLGLTKALVEADYDRPER